MQENIHDEVVERLKPRLSTLRLGDPLDKNTDIGAINSREQLERIRELSDIGEAEGAERWSAPCVIPENGFWFAPTIFTNVQTSSRIAREEIFGPVLSVLTFRTPAEAIAKANNTPYGLSAGIWTDKGSRILAVADQLRAGVDLGEHVQPLRPRRARSAATRSRATAARAAATASPPTSRPPRSASRGEPRARRRRGPSTADAAAAATRRTVDAAPERPSTATKGSQRMSRLAVPKTYKLYIGGAFPRSESGRTYEVLSADGAFLANAAQGLPQGRPRRGRRRPRRRRAAGRAPPPTTAARCSTASPSCSRVAARSSSPRSRRPRASPRAAASAQVDEAIDRWVWYAGWADKFAQVAGNAQPGRRPVLQHLGARADRRRRDRRAAGLARCSASSRRVAPALVAGNAVVVVASERFPLSAISLAEVLATSDVPEGRRQRAHRVAGRDRAVAREPRRRQRARPRRRRATSTGSTLEIAAADTLKRVLRPEQGPDAAAPALGRITAFTETKTVWHTKSLK